VFSLENYFASKSFAEAYEYSNAYPYKEIPNTIRVHRLVTNFGTQEVFVCDKCSSNDKAAEITAIPISSSASVVGLYGWENSTAVGFFVLCLKG
jgi:hypothetical protein